MLDVNDFIAERGGDPERIRESQRKRNAPVEIVDEVIALFNDHRTTQYDASQMRTKINEVQKSISQRKKAGEFAGDLLVEKEELERRRKAQEDSAAEKLVLLTNKVRLVGNYVHESVPVSDNEDNNSVVRTWTPEVPAVLEKPANMLSHHQVLTRLGGYDPERGVKLVGHRGYCLTGYGLFLSVHTHWPIPALRSRTDVITPLQEPSSHQLRPRVPLQQGIHP
jgi:seryl-tRNA synthetase